MWGKVVGCLDTKNIPLLSFLFEGFPYSGQFNEALFGSSKLHR